MATYAELIEQKRKLDEQAAKLQAQIQEQQEAEKSGAVQKVKAIMAEYGLTLEDLQDAKKTRKLGAKSAAAGKKVAAKYRDGAGNEWSGRGLQPKWLKAALAAGKKIEDFAV